MKSENFVKFVYNTVVGCKVDTKLFLCDKNNSYSFESRFPQIYDKLINSSLMQDTLFQL